MWFKNLCVLQLEDSFDLTPEMLHENLLENASRPCGALENFSFGWAPPLGGNNPLLVHAALGYNMLAARKEIKLLPASVVRQYVADRVSEIERSQGRKVGSREKASIREEITMELMPRAFHKVQTLYAYIDPRQKLIVIDTANIKKADEFLEMLRLSLGTFNVMWPTVKNSPNHVMSQWLLNKDLPSGFLLENLCEMVDRKGDGSVVKCVNQDMAADEVSEHIRAGKQVTQLALTWEDRISFILSDNLILKRLRFLDLIMSEANDTQVETPEERFDADFAIMTTAISNLLPAVFKLFGGLVSADSKFVRAKEEVEVEKEEEVAA